MALTEAVIVTDMPKNCKECHLSWQDDYYTENPPLKCNLVYCPTGLDRNAIHEDCPLKSIDGLIEKIEQDDEIFMCIKNNYTTTEAVIPLWRLRQIIKEYCGGEQE